MAMPDLRVYCWGKPNPYTAALDSDYRWWRAGYSLLGGSADLPSDTYTQDAPAGRYVINFPTGLFGTKWLSMSSDLTVGAELKCWTSVPIVIVNASPTTYAEEVNFFVTRHFWSMGAGGGVDDEAGFGTFWGNFKSAFLSGGAWTDKQGNSIPADDSYNDGHQNTDAHKVVSTMGGTKPDLGFGSGWRYDKMPQDANHVPYDTEGSDFRNNPSSVWNRYGFAFCPIQDGTYWSQYTGALDDSAATLLAKFGDPSVLGSGWGSYPSYYNTTSPWKQKDCLLKNFATGDARYDAAAMGRRWGSHLNDGTTNEFGRKTLHRSGLFASYSGTNYALWEPQRYLRGFLLATVYTDGFDGGKSLNGREGKIFGKHFCTVGTTARYYE